MENSSQKLSGPAGMHTHLHRFIWKLDINYTELIKQLPFFAGTFEKCSCHYFLVSVPLKKVKGVYINFEQV